jgi:FSR family fosmidomycin resistance protein-like MFS transporter
MSTSRCRHAEDFVPGKIGAISGLFYGLAFGMGGIGAAVLGTLADITSIEFIYRVCAQISPAEARARG